MAAITDQLGDALDALFQDERRPKAANDKPSSWGPTIRLWVGGDLSAYVPDEQADQDDPYVTLALGPVRIEHRLSVVQWMLETASASLEWAVAAQRERVADSGRDVTP